LKEEAYDASELDMETPVMSGLEAIKRIRRGEAGPHNTDISILVLTAHALDGFRRKRLEAGANDFVTNRSNRKPCSASWMASRSASPNTAR